MTLDLRRPKGQRVIDLMVRCSRCKYPRYNPINMDEIYKVATVNYLLNGGDGHKILKEHKKNTQPGQFLRNRCINIGNLTFITAI